jgi:tetratricopeptide (TPR) repeat protein
MSSSIQPTNSAVETESFEAFDRVTEALEYIDSYNPQLNNKSVFEEAEKSLKAALDEKAADPNYHKAKYFQAMVSYLKGSESDEAVRNFQRLSDSSPNAIEDELAYNLGAAYTHAGRWDDAIQKFNEVTGTANGNSKKSGSNDPELRLFARAGLAHSYAGLIKQVRKEAVSSEIKNENLIKEYSAQIRKQYEFGRLDAGAVFDTKLVKEAEQVIREAYKTVDESGAEFIELLPAQPSEKKQRRLPRRAIIGLTIVFLLLVMGIAVYIELYVGWDYFGRWLTGG